MHKRMRLEVWEGWSLGGFYVYWGYTLFLAQVPIPLVGGQGANQTWPLGYTVANLANYLKQGPPLPGWCVCSFGWWARGQPNLTLRVHCCPPCELVKARPSTTWMCVPLPRLVIRHTQVSLLDVSWLIPAPEPQKPILRVKQRKYEVSYVAQSRAGPLCVCTENRTRYKSGPFYQPCDLYTA